MVGTPGREGNSGKVGNSSREGEARTGSQKAAVALLPGVGGSLAGLWAHGHQGPTEGRPAGRQQTVRLSDVRLSQNDSVVRLAVNGELCAMVSRAPCLRALRAGRVSLLPCPLLPSLPQGPMTTASGCRSGL